MRIQMLRNERGVSLLEVLVAMIILSLALLMLLNMSVIAIDNNDWANKTTQATQALQEKLEEIRASANYTDGQDTVAGEILRQWSTNHIGNHLEEIVVDVLWLDHRNEKHTSSITALVRTDSV